MPAMLSARRARVRHRCAHWSAESAAEEETVTVNPAIVRSDRAPFYPIVPEGPGTGPVESVASVESQGRESSSAKRCLRMLR